MVGVRAQEHNSGSLVVIFWSTMLHLNHLSYHWSRTRVYPVQRPDVNPMNINGMNWNADCTSDLFIHVPDLILLHKSSQPYSKSSGRPFQNSGA